MSHSPTGFRVGPRRLFQAVLAACLGISPVSSQEVQGILQFTDKDFNVLPDGIYWKPDEGAVFLQLKDDWITDGPVTKSVTFSVINNRGADRSDAEKVDLVMVPGKRNGAVGVWEGKLTLKDGSYILPSNGTLETRILGEITAVVGSHKANGEYDTGIQDRLLVAAPDFVAAKIFLENAAGPGIPIGRTTGALMVKVEDQSLTSGTDTVTVVLRCAQTGDNLMVKAIETEPGRYASQPVPKNEDVPLADASLNCRDKDIIYAKYTDPNYGTGTEVNQIIYERKETRITFPKNLDDNDTTDSGPLVEGERDRLFVRVEAYGRKVDAIDSIMVVITSAQGEREHFWAVETGPHTQVFLTLAPIAFISTNPLVANGTLEGRFVAGTPIDPIPLVATVVVDGAENRKEINLVSALPGMVRPGGSSEDMLWWKDGVLGGRWLQLHRPRSIACFDAQGAYLGEARSSGDASVWRLPPGTGVRLVRIRALDGAGLDRILYP